MLGKHGYGVPIEEGSDMAGYETKITGMDEAASHPSGLGALIDVVLVLEPKADAAWADTFEALWKNHFYMQKRNTSAEPGRLVVTCIPNELEGGLLAELKKIAAATNEAMNQHVAEMEQQKQRGDDTEAARRNSLSDLAKKLNFD